MAQFQRKAFIIWPQSRRGLQSERYEPFEKGGFEAEQTVDANGLYMSTPCWWQKKKRSIVLSEWTERRWSGGDVDHIKLCEQAKDLTFIEMAQIVDNTRDFESLDIYLLAYSFNVVKEKNEGKF